MNNGFCSISYNSEEVLEKILYNLAEKGIIGFDYAIFKHEESEFKNAHCHFWINLIHEIDLEALRSNFLEYKVDSDDMSPIGFALPFHKLTYEEWYNIFELSE